MQKISLAKISCMKILQELKISWNFMNENEANSVKVMHNMQLRCWSEIVERVVDESRNYSNAMSLAHCSRRLYLAKWNAGRILVDVMEKLYTNHNNCSYVHYLKLALHNNIL